MGAILLVEDDEKIRDLFTQFLNTKNYEVAQARNGQEAVDTARQRSFALIIMDIKMPKLDGLSALQQIRQFAPTTPVLLITGYQAGEALEHVVNHTTVECVRKPFTFDQLTDVLTRMLETPPPSPPGDAKTAPPPPDAVRTA